MSKLDREFHARDFPHPVAPRVGRSVAVESPPGQTFTESRPRYGMRETGDILKLSKSSIANHLHHYGSVNHFDTLVQQKLSRVVGHPCRSHFQKHFSTEI